MTSGSLCQKKDVSLICYVLVPPRCFHPTPPRHAVFLQLVFIPLPVGALSGVNSAFQLPPRIPTSTLLPIENMWAPICDPGLVGQIRANHFHSQISR